MSKAETKSKKTEKVAEITEVKEVEAKKVESKENRIVIFDSQMKHKGTNTTDKKKRVLLNINYF